MKTRFHILVLLFLPLMTQVQLQALAQPQTPADDAVLARVGGEDITVGEFRARYALTVFPYKDREHLRPVVMRQFLYSMVAERLLAAEARRRGYDAEDRFGRNRRLAEEMFVRDRLFRDSVRSQVEVTEAELRQRYLAEVRSVEFDFRVAGDEAQARNMSLVLSAGTPFDTLLAAQQRSAPDAAGERTVADDVLLAGLDTLAPGAVSDPIPVDGQWYLVRRRTRYDALPDEEEFHQRARRLESELRDEKEAAEMLRFVSRLWRGREATLDEECYRGIGQAMIEEYRRQYDEGSGMLSAPQSLFDSLRLAWRARLQEPFAVIGGDNLTIGDALDRLAALDLRLQREQLRQTAALYRERVRDMLDRHVVTLAGYAAGLQNDAELRRDVAMWEANGLAETIPQLLWEQYVASDDSLWSLYCSRRDLFGPPVEVRVLQVSAADSARLADAVQSFSDGAALEDIAERMVADGESREGNGLSDWFSVTERGTVGRAAFGMRVADAAGPLRDGPALVFFQLHDRRYPGMRLDGWDALRDSASERAQNGVVLARTEQLLRRLASGTRIDIDRALLDAVDVPATQMHSVRLMGFGGRIPAMPGVLPLYEAVMEGMELGGQSVP